MTTKENLETLLNEIWKLGDRDEMSIKHIGHGLAALVAHGDWQRAIDYDRPAAKMTKQKEIYLAHYWELVQKNLDGLNRAECVSLFESVHIAWYGAIYLQWSEYDGKMDTLFAGKTQKEKGKENEQ
jgi:hypothetical protein